MLIRLKILIFLIFYPLLLNASSPERPVAIFHAFNLNYDDLTNEKLSELKKMGFTHIQTSPTQASVEYPSDYRAWHEKYQPLSYKIKNGYGTSDDLKSLTNRAHSEGLRVIADVVLNHLAGVPGAQGGDWLAAMNCRNDDQIRHLKNILFKTYRDLFPGFKEDEVFEIFKPWDGVGWAGGSLPQLNTQNLIVRKVQLNFLKELQKLGIDGFRFDAAGNISPESLIFFLKLTNSKWSYLELIGVTENEINQYNQHIEIGPVTDYLLLKELTEVFSYHGSLSRLKVPKSNGPNSVTFGVSHDTWAALQTGPERGGIGINFHAEKDADLATAFILARRDGVPLILPSDAEKPFIQKALKFRTEMATMNAKTEFIVDSRQLNPQLNDQTFMLMARGNSGLMILNKADNPVSINEMDVTQYLELSGCFKELDRNRFVRVSEVNGKKILKPLEDQFEIQKADALFFIQVGRQECEKELKQS